MARPSPRPRPAGKSKTDLRRGQVTPGVPAGKRTAAPRGGTGTSRAEEAMLFDEPAAGSV